MINKDYKLEAGDQSRSNRRGRTAETQASFELKAKTIHGDKYDYSKSVYVSAKDKVIIQCKEHGEFTQRPDNHLSGQGCPKCKTAKMQLPQAEFLKKANAIHGERYDYADTVYKTAKSKITIRCREHGNFTQIAENHLHGKGCSKCNKGRKQLTQAEFEQRAKEVHGDQYDYSNAVYVDYKVKIAIRCKQHGEFSQAPNAHLSGSGCMKCSKEERLKLRLIEFKQRAKVVHGDTYDYSNSVYTGSDKKILIVCKKHGNFYQVVDNHLNGQGCPQCNKRGKPKFTLDEFKRRADIIHGNHYDYSNSVYTGALNKITIKCLKHGDFEQTPSKHLKGCGCPRC